MIGERVKVRVYADHLEVFYGDRRLEELPRPRGSGRHHINYRHIIDSLVKKPGAFANYKYRADLYPRFVFRLVYDWLREHKPHKADKEYVKVLALAAGGSEEMVDRVCRQLIRQGRPLTYWWIGLGVRTGSPAESTLVAEPRPDLAAYDNLLEGSHAG